MEFAGSFTVLSSRHWDSEAFQLSGVPPIVGAHRFEFRPLLATRATNCMSAILQFVILYPLFGRVCSSLQSDDSGLTLSSVMRMSQHHIDRSMMIGALIVGVVSGAIRIDRGVLLRPRSAGALDGLHVALRFQRGVRFWLDKVEDVLT
jgi:hypothetical protein